MKILMKAGAFFLGLAVVLVGLSYNVLRAQGLESAPTLEGRQLATEVRAVDAGVVDVRLNGAIDLRLKQGATPSMTVHAEQRLLPKISTIQNGTTLHIDVKGFVVNSRQPMVVELTLPALQQLQIRGSGDSKVSGFSGDALKLDLTGSGGVHFNGQYRRINANATGSGDLTLDGGNSESVELSLLGSGDMIAKGSSKSLKASLTGSGDLDASGLATESAAISVLGSGDTSVFAKKTVSVNGKGSGDIHVAGKPAQRDVNVMGSGDVYWE